MKVGDTIYRFDENRRVYRKVESGGSSGSPIYREHWRQVAITGENRASWLMGHPPNYGFRCPKRGPHPGFAFTEQEIDDACWLQEHRYSIERAVGRVRDADTLRKVAALIGWKEPKS